MSGTEGWSWDDLRLVLAARRAGSLGAAGRALGVDASTTSRRLSRLEAALGARLFDRVPEGLRPTPLVEALWPHAEAAEAAVTAFAHAAAGVDARVRGTVRLAVPDGVDSLLVAPRVGDLRAAHPELSLELVASPSVADLARREADLALRLARPSGDLVCRRLGRMVFVPCAVPAVAEADDRRWILGDEGQDPVEAAWARAVVPLDRIALRVNRADARLAAALAGVGVALLPEPVVRQHPALRIVDLPPVPPCDVWLVAHPALRHVPRVAAVWDFVAELAAVLL